MTSRRRLRLTRTASVLIFLASLMYMGATPTGEYWLWVYLAGWIAAVAGALGFLFASERLGGTESRAFRREAHAAPAP